jgi:hypothetical protein
VAEERTPCARRALPHGLHEHFALFFRSRLRRPQPSSELGQTERAVALGQQVQHAARRLEVIAEVPLLHLGMRSDRVLSTAPQGARGTSPAKRLHVRSRLPSGRRVDVARAGLQQAGLRLRGELPELPQRGAGSFRLLRCGRGRLEAEPHRRGRGGERCGAADHEHQRGSGRGGCGRVSPHAFDGRTSAAGEPLRRGHEALASAGLALQLLRLQLALQAPHGRSGPRFAAAGAGQSPGRRFVRGGLRDHLREPSTRGAASDRRNARRPGVPVRPCARVPRVVSAEDPSRREYPSDFPRPHRRERVRGRQEGRGVVHLRARPTRPCSTEA